MISVNAFGPIAAKLLDPDGLPWSFCKVIVGLPDDAANMTATVDVCVPVRERDDITRGEHVQQIRARARKALVDAIAALDAERS